MTAGSHTVMFWLPIEYIYLVSAVVWMLLETWSSNPCVHGIWRYGLWRIIRISSGHCPMMIIKVLSEEKKK